MIIHCNNIGEVKAIADHFSIPINPADQEISFPYAFELKQIVGLPVPDDNEYTFLEFNEKYLTK